MSRRSPSAEADPTALLRVRSSPANPEQPVHSAPMATLGVAIIGSGGIALQNHLPGFALCPDTKFVALCDSNAETLEKASQTYGIKTTFTGWKDAIARDDVHAVVIATPNVFHPPIAMAAAAAG